MKRQQGFFLFAFFLTSLLSNCNSFGRENLDTADSLEEDDLIYASGYYGFTERTKSKEVNLIVSTRIGSPYVMLKETVGNLTGNDVYEGYVIDLLEEISNILHFNYTITLVPDVNYGFFNTATKEWNGLIKELMDKKADIAITDLTITAKRMEVVDFTVPFMNFGVSILYKKPNIEKPGFFHFLKPFSHSIWIYITVAYLGISVFTYLLERFNNYKRYDSTNCLIQEGSYISALSTRIMSGVWWLFVLFMLATYTANLTAFLITRRTGSIESVEDLASQTKIKYGSVQWGSTSYFFQFSSDPVYSKMWSFMDNNPSVFVKNNDEGIQKVLQDNGKYAFLIESPLMEYAIERNCELVQVGGLLNSKSYGIALQRNSSYTNKISEAILTLQELGKMEQLKTKWWKQTATAGKCEDETNSQHSELGIVELSGLFLILIGGILLSCVTAVIEYVWKSKKSSKR